MRSQVNRDMMTALYRMLEKFEDAPAAESADDRRWLTDAAKAMSTFYDAYKGNEFAQEFALAFFNACVNRWKEKNKSLLTY